MIKNFKNFSKTIINENFSNTTKEIEKTLTEAVEKNNTQVVMRLLELGCDPNGDLQSPIKAAARNGNREIFDILVKRGAKLKSKSLYPLIMAMDNGHEELTYHILDLMEFDKTINTDDFKRVKNDVDYWSKVNKKLSKEFIQKVKDRLEEMSSSLNENKTGDQSFLDWKLIKAVYNEDLTEIRRLLEMGSDPKAEHDKPFKVAK